MLQQLHDSIVHRNNTYCHSPPPLWGPSLKAGSALCWSGVHAANTFNNPTVQPLPQLPTEQQHTRSLRSDKDLSDQTPLSVSSSRQSWASSSADGTATRVASSLMGVAAVGVPPQLSG